MRILWHMLPGLALPAAVGLGVAYVATGFLPGPQPALRPPEELRAKGLAMAEESPARAILERNVLRLESPPFTPPGAPLAPPVEPAPAAAALNRPPLPEGTAAQAAAPDPAGAAFAPPEPVLLPMADKNRRRHALSGGYSVQGLVAGPDSCPAGLEGFRLVGVVSGGKSPAAMLEVDGVALTLHPGGQVRGWTLAAVQADRVLFRKAGQTRELPLAGRRP